MSDDKIMVCGDISHVPGSVRVEATCGHSVVVSPSSMQLVLADDAIKLVCLQCMPQPVMNALAAGELTEVPGQRAELRAALGAEVADEFLDKHTKNEYHHREKNEAQEG